MKVKEDDKKYWIVKSDSLRDLELSLARTANGSFSNKTTEHVHMPKCVGFDIEKNMTPQEIFDRVGDDFSRLNAIVEYLVNHGLFFTIYLFPKNDELYGLWMESFQRWTDDNKQSTLQACWDTHVKLVDNEYIKQPVYQDAKSLYDTFIQLEAYKNSFEEALDAEIIIFKKRPIATNLSREQMIAHFTREVIFFISLMQRAPAFILESALGGIRKQVVSPEELQKAISQRDVFLYAHKPGPIMKHAKNFALQIGYLRESLQPVLLKYQQSPIQAECAKPRLAIPSEPAPFTKRLLPRYVAPKDDTVKRKSSSTAKINLFLESLTKLLVKDIELESDRREFLQGFERGYEYGARVVSNLSTFTPINNVSNFSTFFAADDRGKSSAALTGIFTATSIISGP